MGVGSAAPTLDDLRALINTTKSDRTSLHLQASLGLREEPPESRLVVLVDQFEEIFTQCSDDGLRQAFLDNLVYAASKPNGQTVVVLTLRGDFYGNCAFDPALACGPSRPPVAGQSDERGRVSQRDRAAGGAGRLYA